MLMTDVPQVRSRLKHQEQGLPLIAAPCREKTMVGIGKDIGQMQVRPLPCGLELPLLGPESLPIQCGEDIRGRDRLQHPEVIQRDLLRIGHHISLSLIRPGLPQKPVC